MIRPCICETRHEFFPICDEEKLYCAKCGMVLDVDKQLLPMMSVSQFAEMVDNDNK